MIVIRYNLKAARDIFTKRRLIISKTELVSYLFSSVVTLNIYHSLLNFLDCTFGSRLGLSRASGDGGGGL